jgi:hypothetical protein
MIAAKVAMKSDGLAVGAGAAGSTVGSLTDAPFALNHSWSHQSPRRRHSGGVDAISFEDI